MFASHNYTMKAAKPVVMVFRQVKCLESDLASSFAESRSLLAIHIRSARNIRLHFTCECHLNPYCS